MMGSRTLNSTLLCRALSAVRYSERIPFPSTCGVVATVRRSGEALGAERGRGGEGDRARVRGGKRAGPRGPPRARPISAARGGPGLSRPARLQAGLRTASCARPGRGAPTPREAAASPQEWSRAGASAAAAFLRQFRTCLRRDLGTFPVGLRRRWATPGAPAGRWLGEHPPAPVWTSAPRPGRASPTWLRL